MSLLEPSDTRRLLELLEEELKIYGQIQKQTEKQAHLLARDDIETFNDSLEKRAKLIEKIKGLHQESDPLMQSYISLAKDERNSEIDAINKEIHEALEICSRQNVENVTAMKEKTEEQTKKIKKQSEKRKTIGGYAQSVPNTPEVFDKKT